MALLEVQNLQKYYGGVHALKDVSFAIAPEQVMGLAGDNGAGKSTLMQCITGAESPDSGRILFQDKPLNFGSPHFSRMAGIEMIYQDLNLCPQLDVVSNIFWGREKVKPLGKIMLDHKAMFQKAQEVLGTLNAEIPLKAIAGNLSGGQQQAVAIARALLFEPKLLILDEPTAALGIKEVQKVLELIKSLKQQGIAVIIISHRLTDIYEVADRIIFMRRGEIREDKPVGDISMKELTEKIIA